MTKGIVSCNIYLNPNGKSKGFGHINFNTVENAEKAMETLIGAKVDERVIKLAKSKKRNLTTD